MRDHKNYSTSNSLNFSFHKSHSLIKTYRNRSLKLDILTVYFKKEVIQIVH
jgi:hypothetical protein